MAPDGDMQVVKAVLVRPGGHYLLVQHHNRRPENLGKWSLPGGWVEPGDAGAAAALRRELEEEFGIAAGQLHDLHFLGTWPYKDRRYGIYTGRFYGHITGWRQEEVLAVAWCTPEGVRRMEADGRLHKGFEWEAVQQAAQHWQRQTPPDREAFADGAAAAEYDARLDFVPRYGLELIEWLQPRPGERILDLGCGTGDLTAALAAEGAEVTGVDASPEMIRRARAKHPHHSFAVGDARQLPLAAQQYDAVFANAVLHWVTEPRAAAREIFRVLRPGGRLVAELGASGNVGTVLEAVATALTARGLSAPENPWYFPSLGAYTSLLEDAGFAVARAAAFHRPTPLDRESMQAWLTVFGAPLLRDVPPQMRDQVIADVVMRLKGRLGGEEGWSIDYRRLRVTARRPDAP